jgi:tetratricopeptide (TPR) repeat protein
LLEDGEGGMKRVAMVLAVGVLLGCSSDYEKGNEAFEKKKWDEAIEFFSKVTEGDEDYQDAQMKIGNTYSEMAEVALENGDLPSASTMAAKAFETAGNAGVASFEHFGQIARLSGRIEDAYYKRGTAEFEQGRHETATASLVKVTKQNKNHQAAQDLIARASRAIEEAREAAERKLKEEKRAAEKKRKEEQRAAEKKRKEEQRAAKEPYRLVKGKGGPKDTESFFLPGGNYKMVLKMSVKRKVMHGMDITVGGVVFVDLLHEESGRWGLRGNSVNLDPDGAGEFSAETIVRNVESGLYYLHVVCGPSVPWEVGLHRRP